ncbi:type II toxin-antitoxin system VapC family toxin [Parvularcula maris]|uniref:Ribonuclease VapC n=1 Tax=Parvularcula maris TaxID=2965077 RepID=A0A9X2L9R8_9PROT|nr:type II toxin-antitoxin system VapC family toxin [Parvularcula maris]MCQ8184747.1 type II toxin-antitoxin system VapC family toxin [Parvularcula maris]
MIVIDASLTIDLCLSVEGDEAVLAEVRNEGVSLVAPEILDLELVHTLRRLVRRRVLETPRASRALQLFADLQIKRFPHAALLPRIWDLRDNLGAYDAAYFALAEWLDAPLWTRDKKFASVPTHGAAIRVL